MKKKFILLFISLCIIYGMSLKIDRFHASFAAQKGTDTQDMMHKIFGEYRIVLSKLALIKSEEYLHGGISRPLDHNAFYDEHANDDQSHIHYDHGPSCDYGHGPAQKTSGHVSPLNILAYIAEKMTIREHIHLPENEAHEVIPWYIYATRLNPQDTQTYAIGGYWIGRVLSQPDQGIRFLRQGLEHNPDSWEIANEIAMIYLAEKKDFKKALHYSLKSIHFLENVDTDPSEKIKALLVAAHCYDKLGDPQNATLLRQKARNLRVFPRSVKP